MKFHSEYKQLGVVELPQFTGLRLMMLPVIIGDSASIPDFAQSYNRLFEEISDMPHASDHKGCVGYLTIDEKLVKPQTSHRRGGLHVDGIYRGSAGGWGGGGSWGGGEGPIDDDGEPSGPGMLTVSNPPGCIAYNQWFEGTPGDEGECDHLGSQCRNGELLEPNRVYWLNPVCVHESIPLNEETTRQFIRLSLPSTAPWFEGYTENPLGIKPTGPILAEREFMKV